MTTEPLKLLIIDDDPALLMVLEAGIGMLPGIKVTALSRAAEAMALLRRDRFDMLIADYSLGDPAINGLTLLGIAQQQPVRPLSIIITAYASLQISLQSIELGAYDFLTKPFQMEELQLVVRNAAELITARKEANAVRQELARLSESLRLLETNHSALAGKYNQLAGGYDASGTDPGNPALAGALDSPATQELRRRRMRDQVHGYQRMSESLGDQLSRERQRIESLVEGGVIPQETFDRALREGRFVSTSPPGAPPDRQL